MTQDFAKEDQKTDEGVSVCEKCGNAMIWESFDGEISSTEEGKNGEWVCPHCQGEIDFMGEEDDE